MIKNECRHAYKMLDHAECLWCEDCVEKLVNRIQKPKVSRGLIKKHARHMTVNTYYDDDDQKQGKTPMFEYPRVEEALIKFSEEVGLEVEDEKNKS